MSRGNKRDIDERINVLVDRHILSEDAARAQRHLATHEMKRQKFIWTPIHESALSITNVYKEQNACVSCEKRLDVTKHPVFLARSYSTDQAKKGFVALICMKCAFDREGAAMRVTPKEEIVDVWLKSHPKEVTRVDCSLCLESVYFFSLDVAVHEGMICHPKCIKQSTLLVTTTEGMATTKGIYDFLTKTPGKCEEDHLVASKRPFYLVLIKKSAHVVIECSVYKFRVGEISIKVVEYLTSMNGSTVVDGIVATDDNTDDLVPRGDVLIGVIFACRQKTVANTSKIPEGETQTRSDVSTIFLQGSA
jgi:hypothetical protein